MGAEVRVGGRGRKRVGLDRFGFGHQRLEGGAAAAAVAPAGSGRRRCIGAATDTAAAAAAVFARGAALPGSSTCLNYSSTKWAGRYM